MSNRYTVDGGQGTFEPGSDERVLANKLQICKPDEMNDVELVLLKQLYEAVLVDAVLGRTLSVADIKRWHYRWLGNVYSWAGEERMVNMTKDGFPFAAAPQVSRLLDEFQRNLLDRYTPCRGLSRAELVEAIARTHVEFILIHPFREGNGRISRLLADVMAAQAGMELLDYSAWDRQKQQYFAAVQDGFMNNYEPMKQWVNLALPA